MKKVFAIVIIAVMAFTMLAVSANAAPSIQVKWFDVVNLNGPTIQIVGWAIVAEDTLVDFGYRVDDNEPVFSCLQERSVEIVSVMGSDLDKTNGFNLTINESDLPEGEHVIHIVAKTGSGVLLDVNQDGSDGFTVLGTKPADQPNPPSGDAAIIAIATIGCIALAGVVVAKKVR